MIGLSALAGLDLLGWSAALACGSLAAWLWLREGRRRGALNRALHELRRPLQVLALMASPGHSQLSPAATRRNFADPTRSRSQDSARPNPAGAPDPDAGHGAAPSLEVLEQALSAVADLDRAVNGGGAPEPAELVSVRGLIERPVRRWRALLDPAELRFRWLGGAARVLVDPVRFGQALENLIANANEHGRSPITVAVSTHPGRVRIAVGDAGPAIRIGSHPSGNGRRGHGLSVAAEFAAAHGGALRSWQRCDGGTVVAIDLPLAPPHRSAAAMAQRGSSGLGPAPAATRVTAPIRAPAPAESQAPAAPPAAAPADTRIA